MSRRFPMVLVVIVIHVVSIEYFLLVQVSKYGYHFRDPIQTSLNELSSTTNLGCDIELPRDDVESLMRVSEDTYGYSYNGTKYALSLDSLRRSRSNVGHVGRLRRLLCKLSSGIPIHGTMIGGSITNGNGMNSRALRYGEHFQNWLNATFPPLPMHNKSHKIETIAYEATWTCTVLPHIQATFKNKERSDVDLVVLEFAVNDHMATFEDGFEPVAKELWQVVQCTEAMVRFFLSLNPNVCVVMLHMTQAWGEGLGENHIRYPKASHLHSIVSDAYSIPTVDLGRALRNGPENWNCFPRPTFSKELALQIFMYRSEIGPGHELYEEMITRNNETCFQGFWLTDWSHPSPLGHKLTSDVLANLFTSELSFPRSLEIIPKHEHGPWNPMKYGPLSISAKEMGRMINIIYRAEPFVSGSLMVSTNLKFIRLWSQDDNSTSWEYGTDKNRRCWQCMNCTSAIAFRIDLNKDYMYRGRASISLEYKKSYKSHGDFAVFTTFKQPPKPPPHQERNGTCQVYDSRTECPIYGPVLKRAALSGAWEHRNTQWSNSEDIFDWEVTDEPWKSTVFLIVVPISPEAQDEAGHIKIKGIIVHGEMDQI